MTLQSSLDARRSNQSTLKKINPEYSLEGLMLQYFGYLMRRADSLEKILTLGKIEGRRRRGWQRMRWLDGITNSMDTSLRRLQKLWWTGKPGVLQSTGSQRVGHDLATEPNWTERCAAPEIKFESSFFHFASHSAYMLSGFSHVWLFANPWTVAHHTLLSMGLFWHEYWSRLPFSSLEDIPDPGIESMSSALQADSLSSAAAAKSLQLCLTLCDPIDSSPPGSPVPGILQARTLEWVAISFSNAWKWEVKVKLLSHVWPLTTPWTVAYQASLSMGISRQEYWSGLLFPSPIYHLSYS